MKLHYIVDRIPAAGLEVDEQASVEWLGTVLGIAARPAGTSFPVHLRLERAGTNVRLDGRIDIAYTFTCSRCAEDGTRSHTVPIRWSFAEGVDEAAAASDDEVDIDTALVEDDRELSFYTGQAIDIEPALIDQIVFSLPAYPLCREDCRGLCPKCGQNLNEASCPCARGDVDPRFAKLKDIKLGG